MNRWRALASEGQRHNHGDQRSRPSRAGFFLRNLEPISRSTFELIRSGRVLEALAEVDVVVFDKTGTLTTGEPALLEIELLDNRFEADQLLQLAASAEQGLNHPIALAITAAAERRSLATLPVDDWQCQIGRGLRTRQAGRQLLDGDPLPLAVVAGDALPVGVLVLRGELIVQLQQELPEQPLYQQPLQLNPHDSPSQGIERARQLHRQLVPIQLGGAMVALLLGRPHEAAALVQFDPMNDWQLSASVAYGGARSL